MQVVFRQVSTVLIILAAMLYLDGLLRRLDRD